MKTVSSIGDFSSIGFTMVGLGEPRQIRAGVVGGSYFDVMGLHPVLGRLLNDKDDGPNAAGRRGADVSLLDDRRCTAIRRCSAPTVRLGTREATVVGVLEPSVPYPTETEIIANVVTSPHHLSATMVTGREHRMTELFARLAPGADVDTARAELRAVHAGMLSEHPESYPPKSDFRIDAVRLRDQITSKAQHRAAGPARRLGAGVRDRVLERRQPDPGAVGAARRRAGDPCRARRRAARRCGGRCSPRAWCCAAPARSSASRSRSRWSRSSAATPRDSRCARSI